MVVVHNPKHNCVKSIKKRARYSCVCSKVHSRFSSFSPGNRLFLPHLQDSRGGLAYIKAVAN